VAHGGKRPGAGRKRGAATAKTREIADLAIAQGDTPLEVMLRAMRYHLAENNLDRAAAVAKEAAPYVHPRLSATALTGLEHVLNSLPPEFGAEVRRALAAPVPGGNGQAPRP
jgi:hypothetical protein